MSMSLKLTAFFYILASVCASPTNIYSDVEKIVNGFGPVTVQDVDLKLYAGRWYQTHASLIPNQTFEKNGYCITADYTYIDPVTLSVVNAENKGSPTGEIFSMNGTATIPNEEQPGKLRIKFDTKSHLSHPFAGFYWVIELDPNYKWAVVSVPFSLELFILARDVIEFRTTYQDIVLAKVASRGFDKSFNSPLETYQGPDCKYITL
eukprot:gene4306-8566_t